MRTVNILFLLLAFTSCHSQDAKKLEQYDEKTKNIKQYDKKAIELNNEATLILSKNPDSLRKANKLLDSAIKIDPGYTIAYGNKIQTLVKLKEYQEALKWNDSLIAISPIAETIMFKGLLIEKLSGKSEAIKTYQSSYKLFATRYTSSVNLGNLKNLCVNEMLLNGKIRAISLLDKEESKFTSNEMNDLNDFRRYLAELSIDSFL